MITQFAKADAVRTRKAAVAALEAAAAELGLTVETGNGKFTSSEFNFKVTFKTNNADRASFDLLAYQYGLEPSDFGASVRLQDQNYRITGINPRATRMPIMLERVDGQSVKANADMVCRALGH